MDESTDLLADIPDEPALPTNVDSTQLNIVQTQSAIQNPMDTKFSQAVDDAKLQVLKEAALTDQQFISDFEQQLKEATLRLAQIEREKAEAESAKVELVTKNIEYEKELTETRRKLNEYQQAEDKWQNKQKARDFHHRGVKNVMACIGITEPMCIPLLYLLFPFALVFFLIKSFVTATFGNLLCGAVDKDRPKAMKGFLWTILGIFTMCIFALCIWFILDQWIL